MLPHYNVQVFSASENGPASFAFLQEHCGGRAAYSKRSRAHRISIRSRWQRSLRTRRRQRDPGQPR